ncbi:unnamed protein product [Protopolystoma xenopodis]|uniref:DUF1232 domain-containing protein n=1 Tax=Protopolystoma xenopodis TaxID=117903 RepID=A0A448WIL8_9PLAT|nr:unnamed protein product [Protopolystoma xenopodis]
MFWIGLFLVACFSDEELSSARRDSELGALEENIRLFNRRFSDEPVPLLTQLRDLPLLIRHGWPRLFSGESVSFIVRLRFFMLAGAALLYIICPIDLLPEAAIGVFGLVDDVLVFTLFAIYVASFLRDALSITGTPRSQANSPAYVSLVSSNTDMAMTTTFTNPNTAQQIHT